MRTERRTDMTKLIVAFCNFAKSAQKPEGLIRATLEKLDLIVVELTAMAKAVSRYRRCTLPRSALPTVRFTLRLAKFN